MYTLSAKFLQNSQMSITLKSPSGEKHYIPIHLYDPERIRQRSQSAIGVLLHELEDPTCRLEVGKELKVEICELDAAIAAAKSIQR